MKKTALLHAETSGLIASLGHRDRIVIADCGLPVPAHVRKIDLALTRGVPGFIQTLRTVLTELCIEGATIAQEMTSNTELYQAFVEAVGDVPVTATSHENLKTLLRDVPVAAVLRTGEAQPFCNVILECGVSF